jgi:hypothetical protein
MFGALRIRRAAAGAAVLLLHVVILLALLAAFQPRLVRQVLGEREIVISLPVTPETRRSREQPNEVTPPTLLQPEVPHPITLPPVILPPEQPRPEQPQQGDIHALGRYLYYCSGAYYERLSAKEKAHCLENKFNGQEGPALTLGPAKPSPYDEVIAKRNAPVVPIEKPCPDDKPTSNLGLPCLNFPGSHAPLVEFHH